jgi:glycosidase
MQWDATPNAGFCRTASPWLPVHETYETVNVEAQLADNHSLLNTYRTLVHLRCDNAALCEGTLELLDGPEVDRNVLAYRRDLGEATVLVIANLGRAATTFQNPTACRQVLFRIGIDSVPQTDSISLPPHSGLILCK